MYIHKYICFYLVETFETKMTHTTQNFPEMLHAPMNKAKFRLPY